MDKKMAKALITVLEENNRRMFALLPELEDKCGEEEFEFFKREMARVASGIDMKLYSPILLQYPDLDPAKASRS